MGRKPKYTPQPFAYPTTPHIRRHGPFGYKDYESYRDWLRDDFSFRCVFCLKREQWDVQLSNWDIDHFIPQCIDPAGKLNYENLLYVCHSCNNIKSNRLVLNPSEIAFGKCIVVHDDGRIAALNEDGEFLIEQLRLNNEKYTRYRNLIINTIRSLAKNGEKEILTLWMRYPEDLPDLSKHKPPGNSKLDGVGDSHYARRMRGDLSETYWADFLERCLHPPASRILNKMFISTRIG